MFTFKYFNFIFLLFSTVFVHAKYLHSTVSTDKARYAPGDVVQFTIQLNDENVGSSLDISYFHLGHKIDQKLLTSSSNAFSWNWQPPADDFKGYLAEIVLKQNGTPADTVCIAVDVSSNWSKFPRYGFLSKYPLLSQTTIENTIATLNRYHINGLQFYDWHYKHHLPLKGTPDNPASSWLDIANRTNYFPTVAGYISAAHARNIKAMSYNLLFGAYRDAANDGVSTTWRLFKDQLHRQPDYHPLPSSWASDIYLIDPSNSQWINHILTKTADAFSALDFDGWHIDQLGDRGVLYNYGGQQIELADTYAPFIDAAKQSLNKSLVMNAVNQFGQMEIATSPVDFLYTEVWSPNDSYSSLVSIFQKNNAWSDGNLATVLAAYINKPQSSESGFFNTPAVLLADAVIFAGGGAHLELGEHMLSNEYFPNDNLQMTSDLQEQLASYYDFLVAYENLLRDGGELTSNIVESASDVSIRSSLRKGSIWSFAREFENRQVVHLLNFIDATTLNWRDDASNQSEPSKIKNIPVEFTSDKTVTSIWFASPDRNSIAPVSLLFSQKQNTVTFTIPSLKYWDMVVVEYESGMSVNTESITTPEKFHLRNAPNPFNPGTTIYFHLDQQTDLTIDIVNVRGQRVETLLSGEMARGSHSVRWTPSPALPGGVYLVILRESTGKQQCHKVLYVK